MHPFEFGQHLRIRAVVVEVEGVMADDKWTTLSPVRQLGREMIGCGEFNIDVEPLLELRNSYEEARRLGVSFNIQIHRGFSPPVPKGCGTSSHINLPRAWDSHGKSRVKLEQFFAVKQRPHGAGGAWGRRTRVVNRCSAWVSAAGGDGLTQSARLGKRRAAS